MTLREEHEIIGRAMKILATRFTKTHNPKLIREISEMSVRRAELENVMENDKDYLMNKVEEPVTVKRVMDELAALYAQTHDEKVRDEILKLAKQLPAKNPKPSDS